MLEFACLQIYALEENKENAIVTSRDMDTIPIKAGGDFEQQMAEQLGQYEEVKVTEDNRPIGERINDKV